MTAETPLRHPWQHTVIDPWQHTVIASKQENVQLMAGRETVDAHSWHAQYDSRLKDEDIVPLRISS